MIKPLTSEEIKNLFYLGHPAYISSSGKWYKGEYGRGHLTVFLSNKDVEKMTRCVVFSDELMISGMVNDKQLYSAKEYCRENHLRLLRDFGTKKRYVSL